MTSVEYERGRESVKNQVRDNVLNLKAEIDKTRRVDAMTKHYIKWLVDKFIVEQMK